MSRKLRKLASSGRWMAASAGKAARTTISQSRHPGTALRHQQPSPTRADELSATERAELLKQFNAGMALRPKAGPERTAQREELLEKLGTRTRTTLAG